MIDDMLSEIFLDSQTHCNKNDFASRVLLLNLKIEDQQIV